MLFDNKLSRKEGKTLINKISTNQNNKTKNDTHDKWYKYICKGNYTNKLLNSHRDSVCVC